MSESFDRQVWAGFERRLSGVERFIPAPRPWSPLETGLTRPGVRMTPGRALGPTSSTRGRTTHRLAWALVVLGLTIALMAGAIITGFGGHVLRGIVRPPTDHGFHQVGSMDIPRIRHSATLLPDGRVLVAGGSVDLGAGTTAEVYDPITASFAGTGPMAPVFGEPSATLMHDGRVLLTGTRTSEAELFDPATGTFEPTGPMSGRRYGHVAVALPDGRVLIAGGQDGAPGGNPAKAAEIYDPDTGRFGLAGSMIVARNWFTATLLVDGRVFILGGSRTSSAELYDPRLDRFSLAGSPGTPREGHAAVRLADGRVLIAGGWDRTGEDSVPIASAEVYDPVAGTFTPVGSMVLPRTDASATLLPDGRVLITGGGDRAASPEVYDPATESFSRLKTATMVAAMSTATLLANGEVLIAGGLDPLTSAVPTAYVFDYRLSSAP